MKIFPFSKRVGFTLVELMLVVAIIGILTAVAAPYFRKYVAQSKTAETSLNLRKIYDGEVTYFQEEHTDDAGQVITKQFVSTPPTPSGTLGVNKRVGNWDQAEWIAISFAPDGPVLYQYTVDASGTDNDAEFYAYAYGDTDGDSTTSLFSRHCSVDDDGRPTGGAGIYSIDEHE